MNSDSARPPTPVAPAVTPPSTASAAPCVLASAAGELAAELLQRLPVALGPVQAMANGPVPALPAGVSAWRVPDGGPDDWPPLAARVGLVLTGAVDAAAAPTWSPAAGSLLALVRWMQRGGVDTLVLVQPHARGTLPGALRHGLASLEEQAVAALGLRRLLILRVAALPAGPAPGTGLPDRLAGWMLDIFKYMVPGSEQPLRAARLAELVVQALQCAGSGVHVLPPDLLQRAAQDASGEVLRRHLQRPAGAASVASD